MKVIKPYTEIEFFDLQSTDIIAVNKKIEKIARLCYKSEDKITDTSWERMIRILRDRGHWAMLEHHNVVVKVPGEFLDKFVDAYKGHNEELKRCMRYLHFTNTSEFGSLISGSPTAFGKLWETVKFSGEYTDRFSTVHHALCRFVRDAFPHLIAIPTWLEPIHLFTDPPIGELMNLEDIGGILSTNEIRKLTYDIRRHHDMVTVRFVCDRGILAEITRHRPCSFAVESTRYCNYGKDDDIQFIIPEWFSDRTKTILKNRDIPMKWTSPIPIEHWEDMREFEWYASMLEAEHHYNSLIQMGWQPQQARSVLPNSLKTEIYMSATLQEWEWFFKMRVPKTAHPQMRELTIPLQDNFHSLIPEFPLVSE